MKPCWKNRKLIAWLALGALEQERAHKLRAHLETCDRCHRRFEELANLSEKLRAAGFAPEAQTPASFHRRLVNALREQGAPSRQQMLLTPLQEKLLNWRAAFAACVVVAAGVVVWSSVVRHPGPLPLSSPKPPRLTSTTKVQQEPPPPTIANYRLAANRSLDDLDDLLTKQARACSSAAPLYKVSTLVVATSSP